MIAVRNSQTVPNAKPRLAAMADFLLPVGAKVRSHRLKLLAAQPVAQPVAQPGPFFFFFFASTGGGGGGASPRPPPGSATARGWLTLRR